jgi:hypothetical protein
VAGDCGRRGAAAQEHRQQAGAQLCARSSRRTAFCSPARRCRTTSPSCGRCSIFIEPAKFNALDDFLAAFGDHRRRSEQVQQLHRVLQPAILLRRLKEDVEKSIPAKEEIVMNVELTRVQKQYYRAILDRNRTFLSKGCTGGNVPNAAQHHDAAAQAAAVIRT